MRRLDDLETRLKEWAYEYAGGRYENTGWQGMSPLASVMKYHGRSPQGLNPRNLKDVTPADKVQALVDKLEADHSQGLLRVLCLRSFFFHPNWAMAERLEKLRAIGYPIGESTFYARLKEAKRFIADGLGLSLVDDLKTFHKAFPEKVTG